MIVINEIYKNYDRAARFIESCENNFKRTVEKVSESILNSEGVRIVTLCGPTCSGKTTTASILTTYMEQRGKKARVLSIDDFYYGLEEMQKRGKTPLLLKSANFPGGVDYNNKELYPHYEEFGW